MYDWTDDTSLEELSKELADLKADLKTCNGDDEQKIRFEISCLESCIKIFIESQEANKIGRAEYLLDER